MDFIHPNKIEFRWNEFGDYYLYDTRAKVSGLLEFIKVPKNIPRVQKIAAISSPPLVANNPEWALFQVSAVQQSGKNSDKAANKIPTEYANLIKKYPSLLKPDFKNVKHSVEHTIDTTGPPVRCKVRPLLPGSPKAIAGHAAWMQMVDLGIVEKVDANDSQYYSSPLHLQDKPDGTQRPCGDFRLLNDQTLKDATQLPDLNHFASEIKQANYFSNIDVQKAFHFIPIRATDQHKVCVATPWGLYKFKRLAFGLKNAPGAFTRFINEVLHGIPNIYTYLDDILVFTDRKDEHIATVDKVLQRLNQYGLALALLKCSFEQKEVDFLGYLVSSNRITPLDYKIKSIQEFQPPESQKSFLRFFS